MAAAAVPMVHANLEFDGAPQQDHEQQLREALKSAITDTLPSLKDTAKEAVKAAAKEQEAEKKAKDKKEKKETGVKPRDLILPALVCAFMCIPVVSIFLPVYFTAGQAYDAGVNQVDYTCAITEVPAPIARATNNNQKADKSTKNATAFKSLLAARSQRPVSYGVSSAAHAGFGRPTPQASAAVAAYLGYQKCACNQVASLVFDDPGSWNCDSGPSSHGSAYYSDLISTFLGELGDQNYPPPAPPSPPSPPHAPGWVDSPAPPPRVQVAANTGAGGYGYDYSGEYVNSDQSQDYYDYPYSGEAPAPQANPAPGRRLAQTPAPAPTRTRRPGPATVFTALTYNITNPDRLHLQQEQLIVGFVGVRLAVSKVDPQAGTASLSLQATPYSLYTYPFGFLDRKKINVNLPKGVATVTTVLSAVNSASIRHSDGDGTKVLSCDINTVVQKSLYYYPFDTYQATVEIQAQTSDFNDTSTPHGPRYWRTALLVRQRNIAVGWEVKVSSVTDPYDATVENVTSSTDGTGYVRYTITLQRTQFVQFFAVITLIFMWILGTFAVMYAMDGLYLRPRPLAVSDATMFFTAVFAYGNMRNLMPDVPKTVGVGIDFFGYIWIVLMLMGTSALVYCRVVAQQVFNQPTLWDRFFNRDYFLTWTAEQEKKKEEEKKKVAEEKKKKEEEEKAKAAKELECSGVKVVDDDADMKQDAHAAAEQKPHFPTVLAAFQAWTAQQAHQGARLGQAEVKGAAEEKGKEKGKEEEEGVRDSAFKPSDNLLSSSAATTETGPSRTNPSDAKPNGARA